MPAYTYIVIVHAENDEKADQVIAERIDHDEDYGFPYSIEAKTPAMA